MFRKPKLNGLNGMACKEKWMDGRFEPNILFTIFLMSI